MINHRERFLQRCSKKYKDEMATDWIFASIQLTLFPSPQRLSYPHWNSNGHYLIMDVELAAHKIIANEWI